MKLFNTLSRTVQEIKPLHNNTITMYCCGPTVYDTTHIGHIRKYTMDDVLKRVLQYNGFEVKHVMNITDVGHLSEDTDAGEDKLEKGARKTGKSVWDVAQMYTDFFNYTMKKVDVLPPDVESKATEHIQGMIDLIKTLEEKGFTYQTDEAVYFDVTRFTDYGKLSKQKLEEKKQAVREEVQVDPGKKHPADFALWFKRVGRFKDHVMHWESPWGDGFPGWHIECSAMSMQYLGEQIDIHTGGIDHIPVHHENEIAQSEAATGKPFVQCWIHHNFLMVEGEKMSKSLGNVYSVDDVMARGIDPLALRLLFLQTHYRQEMNFTWESAQAANEALKRLRTTVLHLQKDPNNSHDPEEVQEWRAQFADALSNDLMTAQAVATMWEMLKSDMSSHDKLLMMYEFDTVFGLQLAETVADEIPEEIRTLAAEREEARRNKDWGMADTLRSRIEEKGYLVKDGSQGPEISKQ